MRKVAALVLSLMAMSASAQHIHNHYHSGYRGGWLAPVIVGGVIGYELNRPRTETVIVQQQPTVIVQPQPAPQGYHYVTILDPMCNCYKQALVQN